jgi:hypothetical protein
VQAWLNRCQKSGSLEMSPRRSHAFACIGLLLGAFAFGACEKLIGLHDRPELSGDAAVVTELDERLCNAYCDAAIANCSGVAVEAYKDKLSCMAMCQFLPKKKDGKAHTNDNSVECRTYHAQRAASGETEAECAAAAPGGGSPSAATRCGDNCSGYCSAYFGICGNDGEQLKDCTQKCSAVRDRGAFNAEADFNGHDNIQCRISHLTSAALSSVDGDDEDVKLHCGHAGINPWAQIKDPRQCYDATDSPDTQCADFCKMVETACTSSNTVYDDDDQCLAVCKKLQTGDLSSDDSSSDTLTCRRWHAYYALDSDPQTHCPHIGPDGDNGTCGQDVCTAYCDLGYAVCPAKFSSAFGAANSSDAKAQCKQQCSKTKGATGNGTMLAATYSTQSEDINTNSYVCRVHNLAQAASDDAFCSKVLPDVTCSSSHP